MQTGTIIQNFRITAVRPIPELDCRLWEMEHEKTGAQLAWLDRADENKTFGIAFKTIPTDHTGVFHILEHSVLCGSDKYPVKEPFVELLKSSVNTFLNAMTYPDKTVYPISSRNDKDFLNLLDVYMDAVLHPAIYHKPEIFRQEGWRYELREEGPVYQGVVFNEMKGAYASADAELEFAMSKLMFPDNCYSMESGGHPEHIPDLTYEQFIANHQKYYHPSNARIMLCGTVDLEAALSHIDAYLAPYERQSADFPIPMQEAVPYREEKAFFEIGAEESTDERTIVSCGCMLGAYDEQEKLYAAMVLRDYLAGDNDAPLKRAILDAGLAQDLKVNLHDGIQQNWISWEAWNTDEDKVEAIKETVHTLLEKLAAEGLDRERLEACFNSFAFKLRDRDGGWAPRSLAEALTMLDSWLYGGDPAQYLQVEKTLEDLEAKLSTDYYAKLLRELFLDNPHKALTILVPSPTLGDEKRKKEADRVAAESGAWTEADRARIGEEGKVLTAWQQAPDTPEALATIPMLQLSDIDPTPEKLSVTVTERQGTPVLLHKTGSSLVYLNLHFDVSDLTLEELSDAELLTRLLGKLPTRKHTAAQLQLLTKQKIGSLHYSSAVYSGKNPAVRLSANLVSLPSQKETAAEVLTEILTDTLFEDKKTLKDLLDQQLMRLQMQFAGVGHRYARTRALAMVTGDGAAREALSGSTYIRYLKQLCAADDAGLDALLVRLQKIASRAFTRSRMVISVSENGAELAERIPEAFPQGSAALRVDYAPMDRAQVGLPIPAAIGFAAKASNMARHGVSYHGSLFVLENILNFSYLWNEIRVQGGAYGCGFTASADGDICFHTYRDPQPGRSLDIFDRAAEFIRGYCANDPDLTPMILGAMASADPLLNTQMKISLAEGRYFKGTTYEEVCRTRRELIGTTKEDLLALTEVLEALAREDSVCVVAGQPLLDACGEKLSLQQQIL